MTKIALVGQCGIDGPRVESQIHSIVADAEVCSCNDPDALHRACEEGVNLMLFNRLLGFGFDDEEGINLIEEVRASHPDVRLMLISDYPEAQSAAQKAGALPGFGKADLGTPKVEQALRSALS